MTSYRSNSVFGSMWKSRQDVRGTCMCCSNLRDSVFRNVIVEEFRFRAISIVPAVLDQDELILHQYSFLLLLLLFFFFFLRCDSSRWGDALQKSLRPRRFKWDRAEIWQDCSSRKYATTDRVGFLR